MIPGLLQYNQFIVCKFSPKANGKTDKIPFNVNTMKADSAHDPVLWMDYQIAANMVQALGAEYGLGFVFTDNDPFFFGDLDNCLDQNGNWSSVAVDLCGMFPGCAIEISQSGTGLHIFGSYTQKPEHGCKNVPLGLELYTSGRFAALTGTSLQGDAGTVSDAALAQAIQKYFPPQTAAAVEEWRDTPVSEWSGPEDDDELIAKMLSKKSANSVFGNGVTFRDLWENNETALAAWKPSFKPEDPYDRSSADASLAQRLAFWTGKNHERIERLMWKSELKREKWTGHKNYLKNMTICNAVNRQQEVLSAGATKVIESVEPQAVLRAVESFILPSGQHGILESAKTIFSYIAPEKRLFIQGGVMVELRNQHGHCALSRVSPEAFRSRLESYGKQLMKYVTHHLRPALKPSQCSTDTAKALMASEPANQYLHHIRSVIGCPILTDELTVLTKGYHETNGGVLITKGGVPPAVPIDKAVKSLVDLLVDYEFTTASDKSRAIAMMITPMLKMGGIMRSLCPVDVAEANESQSGKTYRQKVVAAIYNDMPVLVASKQGGVGSVDESIGSALATGRPFVQLDNFRGSLDSAYLELAITTPESVPIRLVRKSEQTIDARAVTFQLSSNGVNTTKDMANRSCMIRIRKRHGHRWKKWPEGDLLDHIKANQPYYLGCIISVIKRWVEMGRAKTDTTAHDMREWAQSLDWIIQNLFALPALLEGHSEIQQEVSNPNLSWLRLVCLAAERTNRLNTTLQAHDIAEICEEDGIEWPRGKVFHEDSAATKFVGTLMGQMYRQSESGTVGLDNFTVKREVIDEHDAVNRKMRKKKTYTITLVESVRLAP